MSAPTKSYRVVGEIPTLQSLAFFEVLKGNPNMMTGWVRRYAWCICPGWENKKCPTSEVSYRDMRPIAEIINRPAVWPWMLERIDKWAADMIGFKCSRCGARKGVHRRSYRLVQKYCHGNNWSYEEEYDVYNTFNNDEQRAWWTTRKDNLEERRLSDGPFAWQSE